MKKFIYIMIPLLTLVCLTGCQQSDAKNVEKSMSKIELTGNLVTLEAYYHNVADYEKKAEGGIIHLFDKDRTLWIEYTGTVKLGIDLSKVKIKPNGNQITVIIPATEIFDVNINEKELSKNVFIVDKDGLFNGNKLTMEDSANAVKEAQDTMKENVQNDTQLLNNAQRRAKNLVEGYIEQLSGISSKLYTINWEYVEN